MKSEMEFTGERFVPSLRGQIKYEHLHRYALSLKFAAGKSVLDLASGEGYGSATLAKVAGAVTGVDIDAETVEHARQQYGQYRNLEFMVGSCEAVPLPDKSVDVVTSFETIEHHDKHEQMMLEIKRVLRRDGLLILSSPNKLTYSDEPNYRNPYHVKELYFDELTALLNRHFRFVRVFGQRLAVGSFVSPLQESNGNCFMAYTSMDGQPAQQVCALNSPIYFLVLCSDEELKRQDWDVNSVYVDQDDLHKSLHDEIARNHAKIGDLQHQFEQIQKQLEGAKNLIGSMENSKFWKLRTMLLRLRGLTV